MRIAKYLIAALLIFVNQASPKTVPDRSAFVEPPNDGEGSQVPVDMWTFGKEQTGHFRKAIPVGTPAPDFTVSGLYSVKSIKLADFKKPLVLICGSLT